jgi:hypothetical protein
MDRAMPAPNRSSMNLRIALLGYRSSVVSDIAPSHPPHTIVQRRSGITNNVGRAQAGSDGVSYLKSGRDDASHMTPRHVQSPILLDVAPPPTSRRRLACSRIFRWRWSQ